MANAILELVQTGAPPRAFLAENIDIDPAAFERGLHLREAVVDEVDHRASYIEQNGLDHQFCYPDGNWSPASRNDYLTAYDYVRRGGYEVLNRLRFYGQVFSGYNAMTLQISRGLHSVREVPDDLDQWITAQPLRRTRFARLDKTNRRACLTPTKCVHPKCWGNMAGSLMAA